MSNEGATATESDALIPSVQLPQSACVWKPALVKDRYVTFCYYLPSGNWP
jgi:hypothetical protein